MDEVDLRSRLLADQGASDGEASELLAYNVNAFDHRLHPVPLRLPLVPEPHVAAWERYAEESRELCVYSVLKDHLVQFQFPIQEGISQTEAYRTATRRGSPLEGTPEATGLVLNQPEDLQLLIHGSPAGAIPVLIAGNRDDFESLVRALLMRNEPRPIPASMGATMVAGFNNWDRVYAYRRNWEAQNSKNRCEADWQEEFHRLVPRKELYQDRFIILSRGPYSGVPASDVGFPEKEWLAVSLTIRLEHECTHYFTRRLFGSMRNNLMDELIADYMGIVVAVGEYRADWFLRFLGLEEPARYHEGGRLQNYRGDPPLSDGAFRALQKLVRAAAANLEEFDGTHTGLPGATVSERHYRTLTLMALTYLTLEELASVGAASHLHQLVTELRDKTEGVT